MAITGSIYLSTAAIVLTAPPKYQLTFNVNANSTNLLTKYQLFVDNVQVGVDQIINPNINNYSNTNIAYAVDGTGWHDIGILFFDDQGNTQLFTTRIYLDLTNPILNGFALNRIERDATNDYVVYFDIDVSDETGISRTKIINSNDGTSSEVLVPLSFNDYRAEQSIVVPGFNNNVTKDFYLEWEDYSGNIIQTTSPITVFFTNTLPVITNFEVKEITQTATDYVVTTEIGTSFASYQDIIEYSVTYEDPASVWKNILITTSGGVITDTFTIPLSEPAGLKTLYAKIKDNYQNESNVFPINHLIDKVNPIGSVKLEYAEKIGSNYYANVKFTATDAGLISHYSHNFISENVTNWNVVNPKTQTFNKFKTFNLGTNGQSVMYVKYRDFSGNLSPAYQLPLDIDTTNPEFEFSFDHGELRIDGDYNAFFHLLASDNNKIKFIKLFGVNQITSNLIGSNNWVQIAETNQYEEIRPIVIPATENEDIIKFYYQVRDLYGNYSAFKTIDLNFDKTAPVVNTFTYKDAEKYSTYHRIHFDFNATDNLGIIAYRLGFDDITVESWINVTNTTNLDKSVYVDLYNANELGVTKDVLVQVKDVFGNVSNIASYSVKLEDQSPLGSLTFAGGGLSPTDFLLDFDITGVDTDSDVYWYSLEIDDSTITNWYKVNTPGLNIAQVVQKTLPRASTGRHNFYLRVADIYKNVSPTYNLEYDLDSIAVVGGLEVDDIEKSALNYTANVHLYAFDNRKVKSYSLNGGADTLLVPAVKSFDDYVLVPLGLTPGQKQITVQYKDTFDNLSNTYSVVFNLDNIDPHSNIVFNNATSNTTTMFMNIDTHLTDNQDVYEYKFWYVGDSEPYDYTTLPRGIVNTTINKIFEVPKSDTFPQFTVRVRDFFDNEHSNTLSKIVTTVPPTINSLTVNSISYTVAGINVGVDYVVTADNNSTVDYLDVVVNPSGATQLDAFTVNIDPNVVNATGTFYYDFPIISNFNFEVKAYSDYGYYSAPSYLAQNFDSIGPVISNVTFLGSFDDNNDYILQFRIQGTDATSGIRKIQATALTTPNPITTSYTIDLTNNLDEVVHLRLDRSSTSNYIDVSFILFDLLDNPSNSYTLSNLYLDSDAPQISNTIFNLNKKYGGSVLPGANTPNIEVSFDAYDFSNITHYKYSPNLTETYNASWTSIAEAQTISVTETVNLDTLGLVEGARVFYFHVRDRFNNIATAGINVEYDKTPPSVSTTFLNRIERANVAGIDTFVIPYTLAYSDNYSEVLTLHENYEYGTTSSNTISKNLLPQVTSNTVTERHYVPVNYYGDTTINIALEDRFENVSANSSFNVFLENNPPVIHYAKINNGAVYTTSKDVYIRMDLSDDQGVTERLFSTANNETWNSVGWVPIPYAPARNITPTFSVDLEALGFTQGTCNVYAYIKDFCQNISNTAQTIIYDYEPPVITDFKVNNIIRNINTFEVSLNGYSYDVTSGLDTYYISQSNNHNTYKSVPNAPVIGNTPILFNQIESISNKDTGWKYFYFQTTDAAGNISAKANTQIYIDGLAPVIAFFQPTSTISKYYLNAANNEFEYIVSDDYALTSIQYEIDNSALSVVNTYDANNNILYDANTFLADFSSLVDGEHTIYLNAFDSFNNRVRIPYEFYFDNTPPVITNYDFKKIKPVVPDSTHYDVELRLSAYDNVSVDYYEIYVDGNLLSSVDVDAVNFNHTPTVNTTLTTMFESDLDMTLALIVDGYGGGKILTVAMVENYTGTQTEDDQIKLFANVELGIPTTEINTYAVLGNDIDIITQNTMPGATTTLSDEITSINYGDPAFPTNPYTLIQLQYETGTFPFLPTSTLSNYITNNYSYLVGTGPSPGRYNTAYVTGRFTDLSVKKELHHYVVKVYDNAGNMTQGTLSKFIHNGDNLKIENFTVDSVTTINRTDISDEIFQADISSDVDIIEYALTIHPQIDYDSALWKNFVTPANTISYTETVNTDIFAVSTLSTNKVYLHVKDDCGNVANSHVEINFSSVRPTIVSVDSPINLVREGHYYKGVLRYEMDDPNDVIEAYAIGYEKDPSNFKSLPLYEDTITNLPSGSYTAQTDNSRIIEQQFKIPTEDIDGSKLIYIRLRDQAGNESLNYRISVRALDFETNKFEVTPDSYMFGITNNVNILYDIDSNPTDITYGYRVDDTNEPHVWHTPVLYKNSIGEYYFDFNLDVTSLTPGPHTLHVWLKSKEGELVLKNSTFVSEQSQVAPYAFISIAKTKFEEGVKKVWVEANIFDDGVGVEKICFDENSNPDVFENINIVQNKRIIKLFQYDQFNNNSITYKLKMIDAVNSPSLTYNVSIDLSSVY